MIDLYDLEHRACLDINDAEMLRQDVLGNDIIWLSIIDYHVTCDLYALFDALVIYKYNIVILSLFKIQLFCLNEIL